MAVAAIAVGLGLSAPSQAAVLHPATDPIIRITKKKMFVFDWSTAPAYTPEFSWLSDDAHLDVGNQSPAHVESILESSTWIGVPLTYVSGGSCDIPTNCARGDNNSGTWTYSGIGANVFGIHFGDNFIALLFSETLTSFSITGLPHRVSNIYALTTTPLPGALLLFASSLGCVGLFNWLRKRMGNRPCTAAS